MNRERTSRIALGLIVVFMLATALQATFSPRSFFDDFPLGRGWIAHEGDAYNEHLVRDVGVLFLALIVATIWMLWRHHDTQPIAAAWLVLGLLHLYYHAGHLSGYKTVDKFGLIGSLAAIPVLAAIALWAGAGSPPDEAESG